MSMILEIEHGMEALISYGKIKHEKYPKIWKRYLPPEAPFGNEFDADDSELSTLIEKHDQRFFLIRWAKRFIYPGNIEEKRAYLSYIQAIKAYNTLRFHGDVIQPKDIDKLKKVYSSLSMTQRMRSFIRQLTNFYIKSLDPKEREKEQEEEVPMFVGESKLLEKQIEEQDDLISNINLDKDPNLKAFITDIDQEIERLRSEIPDCKSDDALKQLATRIHETRDSFKAKKEVLFKETDTMYQGTGFFNRMVQNTKWLFTKRNAAIERKLVTLRSSTQDIFTQAVISWIDLELVKFIQTNLPTLANYDPHRNYIAELTLQFKEYADDKISKYESLYGALLTSDYNKKMKEGREFCEKKIKRKIIALHKAKADELCEEMLNKLHEMGREYVSKKEALEGTSIEGISSPNWSLYGEFDRTANQLRDYYCYSTYTKCFDKTVLLDDWFSKFSKTEREYLDLGSDIYGRKCDEIREQSKTMRGAELTDALKEAEKNLKIWKQKSHDQRCKDDLTICFDWPQRSAISTTSVLVAMQIYQSDLLKLKNNYFKLTYILKYYAQNTIPIKILKDLVDDYCSQCKIITKNLLLKYAFDRNVSNVNSIEVTNFIQYCPEQFRNLNQTINDAMALYQVALENRNTNAFVFDKATQLFGELVKEISNKIQTINPTNQEICVNNNTVQNVN